MCELAYYPWCLSSEIDMGGHIIDFNFLLFFGKRRWWGLPCVCGARAGDGGASSGGGGASTTLAEEAVGGRMPAVEGAKRGNERL